MSDFSLDEYQTAATRTAIYRSSPYGMSHLQAVMYCALGLGEAGEVQNTIKKIIRDDQAIITEERRSKILEELGDLLWYVAALAGELGTSLSEVAEGNLSKLAARWDEGTIPGFGDR